MKKICKKHGRLKKSEVYITKKGYSVCKECSNEATRRWIKKKKNKLNKSKVKKPKKK